MAGFLTLDGADYLLSLFTGSEQLVTTYWVALLLQDPGLSTAGEELIEPDFDDYSRAKIDVVSGSFAIDSGELTNAIEITFPAPATEWGLVTSWALCDSQEGGRVLFAGDLEDFDVVIDEQPFLPPGSMAISLDVAGWRDDQ